MSVTKLPDNWTRVRLGEVITRTSKRCIPEVSQSMRWIGADHLEEGDLSVRRWSTTDDPMFPPTFCFSVPSGSVLLHSRNPKKVAILPFDAITGEKLFCLAPVDTSALDHRFLAYQLQSDHFHEFVGRWLSGSVNKFLNWTALARYEFALPPIDEQQRIVQVLSSADGATKSYEKVLASADNLRMSLLRSEMADLRHRYPTVSLDELVLSGVVQLGRGRVISREDLKAFPGDYPVYSSAQGNDGAIGSYGQYMFDEELITWSVDGGGRPFHRKRHKFSVTNIGGYARVLDSTKLTYQFLFLALVDEWSQVRFDWQFKAHPSVIRRVYRSIPTPPIGIQEELLAAVSHVEELGLSARSALQAAKPLRASLLQSLLGASYVH